MYPHANDELGIELAKAVCKRCPVQPECLAYALERGEQWGVWGGTSEEERRSIKRRATRARNRQQNPQATKAKKPKAKKPAKTVTIVPLSDLL